MTRTIRTFRQPDFSSLDKKESFLILTPHRSTARSIGVLPKSLETVAKEIVTGAGYAVASDLTALIIRRAAVMKVVKNQNASAYLSRITTILDTVLRTGVDPNILRASDSANVRQLGEVADKYLEILKDLKMIDRAQTLLCASAQNPQKQKVLVYGYFRGRPEEARFIDALAADDSIYFLPIDKAHWFKANRAITENLVAKGWTLEDAGMPQEGAGASATEVLLWNEQHSEEKEIRGASGECYKAYEFANREREIRATLAKVKNLVLGGVAQSDVAIVVRRTSEYGPETARIAEEYGMHLDMRFKIPVRDTGFGGFMQLVAEALVSPRFETVLRLVMHPYGPGLSEEQLASAFKWHPASLEDWRSIGVDISFLGPHEKLTRAGWRSFVEALFKKFKTRDATSVKAREILAFNEFNDCLREFCIVEAEELSVRQFAAEILEILNACSVHFNPTNGGVGFHDPDTAIGGVFKHLFVMGASEGDLPAAVSDNPVVDFIERKKLAERSAIFETASDISCWEAMSFYFTLLTASDSVTLSYAKTVGADEKLKSEVFKDLGVNPQTFAGQHDVASSMGELRLTKIRQEGISDDFALERARNAYAVELRRESSESQDEFDGRVGVPYDNPDHKWSASQLKNIGQCGFKWFAEKLLRLKPIEEMEGELTPATQGSLYHKTLELAVIRADKSKDIREAMLDVLDDAFAEAEQDGEVGLPVLVNWQYERGEHLKLLRTAIRSEDFIREGARIIATEFEFDTKWKGFQVTGSVDRIDATPDGLIAIDYKTGKSTPKGVKNREGKAAIDIQIPIYLSAAVPTHESSQGGPGTEGYYFSLKKAKSLKKVRLDNEVELDDFVLRVRQMLSEGDFSVSPDVDQNACTFCDYEAVCRKGNRIKRKEAAKKNGQSV